MKTQEEIDSKIPKKTNEAAEIKEPERPIIYIRVSDDPFSREAKKLNGDDQYKKNIFKVAQKALGIKIIADEKYGTGCIKLTSDNENARGGKFYFDNQQWKVTWFNSKSFNNEREGDGVSPVEIFFDKIEPKATADTTNDEMPEKGEEAIKLSAFDLRLISHIQELINKINKIKEEPDGQIKNIKLDKMMIDLDTIMDNCIDSDKFADKHCFPGESKYFNGHIFYPEDKDYGLSRLNKLKIKRIYKKPDGNFSLIDENGFHNTLPAGYKIFYGDGHHHHEAWRYIAEQPTMLKHFIRKDNQGEINRKNEAKTFLENNGECPKFDIYTRNIFDSRGVAHTETNKILLNNGEKDFLKAGDEQAKKDDLFFYRIYYSSYGGTQAEIKPLKYAYITNDENKGREQGLGFLVEYAGNVIINDQLFKEIIILKDNTGENIENSKDLNPFKFVLKKVKKEEGNSNENKFYVSTSVSQISIAQLKLSHDNDSLLIELPFQSPEKGNPVKKKTKEKIRKIVQEEISNKVKELINYLDVIEHNMVMDGQTMFELVNFIKTGKATSGIIYKTFAAICTKAYLVSDRFGLNQKGNTITLEIPNEDKGLLIGKGGKNIKKINEALNALRPGAKCIIK